MTLADLQPGQTAVIESVDTASPGLIRLMVLGLVEGVDVRFENSAIGGDPLEISVFGASISVRREQAEKIRLTPVKFAIPLMQSPEVENAIAHG